MTMLSFRVDDEDAAAVQRWSDQLGVDRSSLLRDAVRQHLNRLASEHDADRWEALPLTDGDWQRHLVDTLPVVAPETSGPAEPEPPGPVFGDGVDAGVHHTGDGRDLDGQILGYDGGRQTDRQDGPPEKTEGCQRIGRARGRGAWGRLGPLRAT